MGLVQVLSLVTATPSLLSCHSLVIKYGAWLSCVTATPSMLSCHSLVIKYGAWLSCVTATPSMWSCHSLVIKYGAWLSCVVCEWSDCCRCCRWSRQLLQWVLWHMMGTGRIAAGVVAGHGNSFNEYYGIWWELVGLLQVLSLVTATPSMSIMAYDGNWSDCCRCCRWSRQLLQWVLWHMMGTGRIAAGVVAGHGNSFNEYYGIWWELVGLLQVLSLVTATPSMSIMAYDGNWSDCCRCCRWSRQLLQWVLWPMMWFGWTADLVDMFFRGWGPPPPLSLILFLASPS